MSPVALESEADIFVLPALSSPPLHRGKKAEPSSPLPVITGGRGEGGAQPKCFTADVAVLPQQPFPIQN